MEGNFRYDGSSKFQPENRWAFFWGVSGGWRLSEEEFVKKLNLFDELKLRLSYGTVGNQEVLIVMTAFSFIITRRIQVL